MSELDSERFTRNAMDIFDALCPGGFAGRGMMEAMVGSMIGYPVGVIIQWLNNNGYEVAAQALDDELYPREDQWWREPDGFDTHYKNGDEMRQEIFGEA